MLMIQPTLSDIAPSPLWSASTVHDEAVGPTPQMTTQVDELETTLSERFGLEAFRPWQREAIDALLEGSGRALVIAPTGGGKSLCYQLPATVLAGTTVVVSPLIALMEDQVRSLTERGIAATYIASNLDPGERRDRMRRLADGAFKLAYVAPERLRSGTTVDLLKRLRPPLVAIDEAHCISQWGHDFRPDYLRLGAFVAEVAPERVLACTATATPAVREEIAERLGMPEDTAVILRGFARPNLRLEVEETDRLANRRRAAVAKVRETLGDPSEAEEGAIIYAGTRKNTEKLAELMCEQGWQAKPYHAGLDPKQREDVSQRFAARELNVVVATNAFGMGIDRPDIRVVVHLMAPGSIEQYYQEVGRAGRDGAPAHGLLLSGTSDYAFRRRLIEYAKGEASGDVGHLDREWRLFLDLMRYVEAGSCRHDFILDYFGDASEALGGCGHCDVCEHLDDNESRTGRAMTEDETIVVRKALSGVARLRRRAGLTALAASLHGANTARLEQLGLTRLSTHGILSEYAQEWITRLLRRLLTATLIELTPSEFPVPYLTQEGIAVMKGERKARLVLPTRTAKKKKKKKTKRSRAKGASEDCADPALFEKLRGVRATIAKARGVAAFVVCHNRSLVDMANSKPQTADALLEVHGMGPTKVDTYGEAFVAAIVEHLGAPQSGREPPA
jgi:ATP-dependent DNA helicase RecQ